MKSEIAWLSISFKLHTFILINHTPISTPFHVCCLVLATVYGCEARLFHRMMPSFVSLLTQIPHSMLLHHPLQQHPLNLEPAYTEQLPSMDSKSDHSATTRVLRSRSRRRSKRRSQSIPSSLCFALTEDQRYIKCCNAEGRSHKLSSRDLGARAPRSTNRSEHHNISSFWRRKFKFIG